MRANTNIGRKKRYTHTLGDFRGVDLSSSPLRVSTYHATEMRNFICENGVNHKRHGWRELFSLGARINGVFPFKDDAHDVLLVHAGTRFWRVMRDGDAWEREDITKDLSVRDERSQCFYRENKAFIVGCGAFLVYGQNSAYTNAYTLEHVSDHAFVPTTTINIDCDGVLDMARGSLDSVNLLTPWRKNTLVGANSEKEAVYSWELDGVVDEGSVFSLTADIRNPEQATCVGTISAQGNITEPDEIDEKHSGYSLELGFEGFDLDEEGLDAAFGLAPKMWLDGDRKRLYANFPTYTSNESANITVKFSVTVRTHREMIENCRFGTLFGVDGATDRLFLSGNPAQRGVDFWSEAGDFTYFPDGNRMSVGGGEAEITGYARLSDAVLAIFKEGAQGYPTLYYRAGKMTTQIDADGDEIPVAYFPVVAGVLGEGAITPHAIANLWGDDVILSKNGVFGIELSANVSSGERYARERSRPIYEELRRADLSDAVAIVHDGRYYLSLGNGVCYVADARYRVSTEGSPDTGYEWWVWDNVPARTFFLLDGALAFGDADGRICLFDNEFADRTLRDLVMGEVTVSAESGRVVFGGEAPMNGDRITLMGDVYGLLCRDVQLDGEGRCVLDPGLLLRIVPGMTVCADEVGESGLASGVPYIVEDVDAGELFFTLLDKDGARITPSAPGFTLCVPLSGVECLVGDVDAAGQSFALCGLDGSAWELIAYGGVPTSGIHGRVIHGEPVVARWCTPVLDLGTSMARKTLLAMCVTTEPGVRGTVQCGFETRQLETCMHAIGTSPFDFGALDFESFSFDTGFAQSFTRRLNVRNFNYIVFRIYSDTAEDCAVSSIAIEYKINQTNRGIF